MKKEILSVISNVPLTDGIWRIVLDGCSECRPGQFVNIALDGLYLRRPISVSGWKDGVLTLVYKVVGRGTALMTGLEPGDRVDALTGLGNGFDTAVACKAPLLIGGGIGCAPLFMLAEELLSSGKDVTIVCGYRTSGEIVDMSGLEALGAKVLLATEDGSAGVRGFVTDAIAAGAGNYDYYYACGPLPMLKAIVAGLDCDGELSLEERMGCGFGICMGCTCKTSRGPARVCKEGPVFKKNEILW